MNTTNLDDDAVSDAVIEWAVLIAKAAALGMVGIDAATDRPRNGFRAAIASTEEGTR